MRSYLCIMLFCSAVIFFLPCRVLAADPPNPLIWWPSTNSMYYEQAICQLWVDVVGSSNTPDFHILDAWGCDLHVTSTQQYFSHTHRNWSSSGGELVTPGLIYGSTMQSGEWGGYVGSVQDGGYGGSDPYHTEVYLLDTTVTFDLTPPQYYHCYFDLEGVAFFDGQTNKYFTADLYILLPEGASLVHAQTYVINTSGAYTKSYGPYVLTEEMASMYSHYWLINAPGYLEMRIDGPAMSGTNPDCYHYVSKLDWQDWNTNSPYVPSDPPVDPTNTVSSEPYPDYPGPWSTNTYGPCPPYYSPWPPNYPPPPPLTNWPSTPPPNWPYQWPTIPTNYPPGTGDGGGGGGTNYGFNWSLDDFYKMFRAALRDEGQAAVPSLPGEYGWTYSNDVVQKVADYTDKYLAAADELQTNADAVLVKGHDVLKSAVDVLDLPTEIGQVTEIDFGTMPVFEKAFVINISDWPIIGIWRSFIKWVLYFVFFWLFFRLIRRTIAGTD